LTEITIPLRSQDEAMLVLGPYDRYAKLLRQALDIDVANREGNLRLRGSEEQVAQAQRRIEHLLGKARKGRKLGVSEIETILLGNSEMPGNGGASGLRHSAPNFRKQSTPTPRLRLRPVEPRNENQRRYLDEIDSKDLIFGSGAAGTGKTFIAVSAAMRLLREGEVRRLVVTRPVVEAGEHLGFLPGDLQAKLNPYMRPIYDAFFDLIEAEDLARLEEAGVIEVAPLAYMRGRTLAHSFVILDEGQNATIPQMKMFLTRMGDGSKVVVTGDPSQNDLSATTRSGFNDAVARLRSLENVGLIEFMPEDIVRHPLVEQIVRAYQAPSRIRPKGEEEDD
jgi:phosphate starvation-inducible PhoH-like protein